MKFTLASTLLTLASAKVSLLTFDGSSETGSHELKLTNDPVMGGQSVSTFTANAENQSINWSGEVKEVPSLKAPGFCNLETNKNFDSFPDSSNNSHIVIVMRSTKPYDGLKLSFAADTLNPQFKSFKADFTMEHTGDWETIFIPYNSFSNNWSSYTGEPIVKCSDDPSVCPTEKNKADIQQLGLWTEGAAGEFDLEIKEIYADQIADLYDESQHTSLVTFDDADATTFDWDLVNDPVMGGLSNSTMTIHDNTLFWEGSVEIVPSLSAPGFCNLKSHKSFDKFNDATGATHMFIRAVSHKPYDGLKFSFAADTLNPQFKCFKADFVMEHTGEEELIAIPLTEFSNEWSASTGEPTTKCSDNEKVCPTQKNLADIQQVGLWMEGSEGAFSLEIKEVWAGVPEAVEAEVQAPTCSAQKNLKYNTGSFTAADVGLPNAPDGESLADAICCDGDFAAYAEPNQFYAQPSVGLFRKLSDSGTTIFYDSVCGLPLFEAPMGRTLDEFKAETEEHGWPSFRPEEVIDDNVVIAENGRDVFSKCGTKLGTNEPDSDDMRVRYCLDLVCVSGNKV